MAYRNFNPGERDRNWRDPWRRERDYGDHPERYGEHRSRAGLRDDRNAYVWRGGRDEWRDDWSDDRYHARGLADAFGDFTMPDDGSMLRWSDVDEESLSASDWRRDRGDWLEDRYDARTARDT